ncbi:hypothetical protein TMatcc_005450 [Talaromyces marneffei ATCC 18224]
MLSNIHGWYKTNLPAHNDRQRSNGSYREELSVNNSTNLKDRMSQYEVVAECCLLSTAYACYGLGASNSA